MDTAFPPEKIEEFCKKSKFSFETNDQNKDIFHYYYMITLTGGFDISVDLALRKEFEYRLEVISSIAFSPVHVEKLKNAREVEIQNMVKEIKMWILPRNGELSVYLNKQNNFQDAYFTVNNPIYEDEFIIKNFEKNIYKSINQTELIIMIINKHLSGIPSESLRS
jgi:hypothetical protein